MSKIDHIPQVYSVVQNIFLKALRNGKYNKIEKLEREFYDSLPQGGHQIKVVTLITRVHRNTEIPKEEIVNSALGQLALRDDIEIYDLIHRWLHSEIKRAIKGIT